MRWPRWSGVVLPVVCLGLFQAHALRASDESEVRAEQASMDRTRGDWLARKRALVRSELTSTWTQEARSDLSSGRAPQRTRTLAELLPGDVVLLAPEQGVGGASSRALLTAEDAYRKVVPPKTTNEELQKKALQRGKDVVAALTSEAERERLRRKVGQVARIGVAELGHASPSAVARDARDVAEAFLRGGTRRPSHTVTVVGRTSSSRLIILDDTFGEGSRLISESVFLSRYGRRPMYVARVQAPVDGAALMATARETSRKARTGKLVGTNYGLLGDDLVCSEISAFAVGRATGLPLTGKGAGPVDVLPADFMDPNGLGRYFIIYPLIPR